MKNNFWSHWIDRFVHQLGDEELIVLESQLQDHPSSNRSYVAAIPKSSIYGVGTHITQMENGHVTKMEMNPWEALKQYRNEKKAWLFGYIGYDLKNFTENLSSSNPMLVHTPDFYFMEPSVFLSVENGGSVPVSPDSSGDRRPDGEWRGGKTGEIGDLTPAISKTDYIQNVEWIKMRIAEGDFYEANYSFPMVGTYSGTPYWLYQRMREINPVPFGGYIQTENFSVCSASPERFLKKSGSRLISEPIKGTTPRSDDPKKDQYYKQLLANEKNRAENLMIVDLVRHDLSTVAKTGSVTVSKLYDIQSFGTVHQLISTIEAEIEAGLDAVDILRACFPMGSMTGAPKIRVMNVLDELEIYRRGIYSGSIGYFTPDGDFDFNVVIRSAIIQNGRLIYPVGGAITSDSDPENEWEETRVKARGITKVYENTGLRQ